MADDAISEHVFLDTEVYVHFGFQYLSTPFKSLSELIAKGRLRLVITNIVVREVEARIEKSVRTAYNAHKEFSEKGRVLGSSDVAGVADKVKWFKRDEVTKDLKEKFHKFLKDNDAIIIETDNISIDDLMDDYFGGEPPFGSGEPKPEFPDAITVKALAEWGEQEEVHILVASGDKGVRAACDLVECLHPQEEIQKVLDHVASDDEKLAEFVRQQVQKCADEIGKKVSHEFQDRYFYVIDENGDADVTVEEATLENVEILEISFNEAVVDVSYRLEYEAEVSYDDPDMQSYDSETGTVMSWGKKEETVHRTDWARADVRVTFSGLDPKSFEIADVTVTEPTDSIGVRLEDPRDYK